MTARALSRDRVFFDLSSRLKLRVTGADRLRFLNGQLTNDVRKASQTNAIEACVLNAKGKMDAHVFVHTESDSFLLDADSVLQSSLQARLERYIIADDVQIEDVTKSLSIFHVIGAVAELRSFDPQRLSAKILSANRFGLSGHDIWIEANQHDEVAAELGQEVNFCDEECAEVFRIERGIPRWGRELTGEIIPVEANLEERCIDYEKGCYIGQEVISRMKISGQRNKRLCGLVSLRRVPLSSGTKLISPDGKEIGWITSTARIGERELALGYVKRGFNSAGSQIDAISSESGLVPVEVVDLPLDRSSI